MNKSILIGLTGIALMTAAHADLIGDNLTIRRTYPTLAVDIAGPVFTTVVAGTSDIVSPQAGLYSINPEAENIYIDFIGSSGFEGAASGYPFDGLQFLGFGEEVVAVTLISATGITVSGLTFDAGHINLNLGGRFAAGAAINLRVETLSQGPAPEAVPEPSTMALMGLALGLAAFFARRGRSKQA